MKHLVFLLSLLISVIFSTNAQQLKITRLDYFKTSDQMLLANEMNESGEPFAEFLGYNLDDLDPFVRNKPDTISYTLGIENYEYSRYQLGTVNSRSGIGLHLVWARLSARWLLWSQRALTALLPVARPTGTMKMMNSRKILCTLA